MDDVGAPLLENLRTAVWVVYALLGGLGLLAVAIDGLADGVFFRRVGQALVRPNPPRAWLWLLVLFVLTCFLEIFVIIPVVRPNGLWSLHLLAVVFPERFETAWLSNIFEEVFRFGGFFLLIKFVRPTAALFATALLFTFAHDYYHRLPLDETLAAYTLAFMLGVLFLFIGLRFGVLTVYAFHVATNVLELGVYVDAPSGWLWVNWLLALLTVVPLVYAFRRAGLESCQAAPNAAPDLATK